MYLLKPDLLRTYHQNEINKAKVLKRQRQRCKNWLGLILLHKMSKIYKQALVTKIEAIALAKAKMEASLTIILLA